MMPVLMLFLFYVNVSGMYPQSHLPSQPLMILAPWVILHVGWSIPMVSTLGNHLYLLTWNREAELKPTTFSSLQKLFLVFLSFLFS